MHLITNIANIYKKKINLINHNYILNRFNRFTFVATENM